MNRNTNKTNAKNMSSYTRAPIEGNYIKKCKQGQREP